MTKSNEGRKYDYENTFGGKRLQIKSVARKILLPSQRPLILAVPVLSSNRHFPLWEKCRWRITQAGLSPAQSAARGLSLVRHRRLPGFDVRLR